MEKQEYIEEVNLIKEQNDTEFEIYPMAVEIIQPTIKNLSKRYVFARRKTDKGQIYYGISSFPDVAILDKKFINISNKTISEEVWPQLKGCLEVKALETKLITQDQVEKVISTKPDILKSEIGQLIGEILWYKKVLYTNGIEWRCLYIKEYSEELIKRIIEITGYVQNGIYTPNEARSYMNKPRKEGGDELICNGNYIKVAQIGIEEKKEGGGDNG